jgi:tRNA1(Val) A37 N6-methylase TrmN6
MDTTVDTLLGGSIHFRQPREGYRVNVDTLLLAAFAAQAWTRTQLLGQRGPGHGGAAHEPARRASPPRVGLVGDLGSGVGVASLALNHWLRVDRAVLVERVPAFAAWARENLANAGLAGECVQADLCEGCPTELRGRADLVISNPPFFEGEAHAPRHPLSREARHGSVEPFLGAARAALRGARGRVVFAYPARALGSLLASAAALGLYAKRIRAVHATAPEPARLVLLEFRATRPGGLVLLPPLVEWAAPGERTHELNTVVNGG